MFGGVGVKDPGHQQLWLTRDQLQHLLTPNLGFSRLLQGDPHSSHLWPRFRFLQPTREPAGGPKTKTPLTQTQPTPKLGLEPTGFFFFNLFFIFLQLHLHMEVLRLGVQLELQLPAYTTATATATRDSSLISNLHHRSRQHRIFNSLSKARD